MAETKKTIGTTTLAATGGASVIGIALATLIVKLVPGDLGTDGFAALAVVLSAVCGLAGGFLSPSKAAEIAPYLRSASEDIAAEVADALAAKIDTGYTGQHTSVVDGPTPYPDLDAIAKTPV